MKGTNYIILTLITLFLTGCTSNEITEVRSERDEELIEAMLYHHEFKISSMIDALSDDKNIDKLIVSDRVAVETNKWTPLCFAAFVGNSKAVGQLLNLGANINFRDANGQSPISLASIAGNIEEINALLKLGADINDKDNNGSTPLIHAASHGNIETVKFLVKAGCTVEPSKGQSALRFATFHQQDEVIQYLKELEKVN